MRSRIPPAPYDARINASGAYPDVRFGVGIERYSAGRRELQFRRPLQAAQAPDPRAALLLITCATILAGIATCFFQIVAI